MKRRLCYEHIGVSIEEGNCAVCNLKADLITARQEIGELKEGLRFFGKDALIAEIEQLRQESDANQRVIDRARDDISKFIKDEMMRDNQNASLKAEVERLKAEIELMRKQITDAIPELPEVAGTLAHRIRFMREQYDGWCREYKAERNKLREAVRLIAEKTGIHSSMVAHEAYQIAKAALLGGGK